MNITSYEINEKLPDEICNKIYMSLGEHPTAIIIKNYNKLQMLINIDEILHTIQIYTANADEYDMIAEIRSMLDNCERIEDVSLTIVKKIYSIIGIYIEYIPEEFDETQTIIVNLKNIIDRSTERNIPN